LERLGSQVLAAAARTAGHRDRATGQLLDGVDLARVEQLLADHEAGRAVLEGLETPGCEHAHVDALVPAVPQRGDDGDAAHVDLALFEERDRFGARSNGVDGDVEAVLLEEAALGRNVEGRELEDGYVGHAYLLRRVEWGYFALGEGQRAGHQRGRQQCAEKAAESTSRHLFLQWD